MPISTKATVFSGCKTLIVIFLPARSTFVQEAHYNKPRIYNDWHTLISQLRNNTWRGTGQEKSIGRGTVVPKPIGFLSCPDPCVRSFVTRNLPPGMPQVEPCAGHATPPPPPTFDRLIVRAAAARSTSIGTPPPTFIIVGAPPMPVQPQPFFA